MKFFGRFAYREDKSLVADFRDFMTDHKVTYFETLPEGIDAHEFFSKLARDAGRFVPRDENYRDGSRSEEAGEWLDISFKEELKHATFRHSDTRQPLHTDGAYTSYDFDISFIYCKIQAELGGATTFLDTDQLCQILQRYEPQMFEQLCVSEVLFDKGNSQSKNSKIIDKDATGWLVNWNHFRVSKSNNEQTLDLCDRFHRFLEDKIVASDIPTALTLQPRSAVFFHDMRVLHGRNAFFGHRLLMKGGMNLI